MWVSYWRHALKGCFESPVTSLYSVLLPWCPEVSISAPLCEPQHTTKDHPSLIETPETMSRNKSIFLPVGLLTCLSQLWDDTIIKVKKHIRQVKILNMELSCLQIKRSHSQIINMSINREVLLSFCVQDWSWISAFVTDSISCVSLLCGRVWVELMSLASEFLAFQP